MVTRRGVARDHVVVDESDLAECYREHSAALLHFAASQVGVSDADDVLSTAVVGVLRRSRQGGDSEAQAIDDPLRYLYRAVANASAKHWRSAERRTDRDVSFYLATERLHGDSGSQPGGADLPEGVPEMLAAMTSLTVAERAAVHLTYWEDLTPAMVADRLDVSDGTIRRQLARARAKLREALNG